MPLLVELVSLIDKDGISSSAEMNLVIFYFVCLFCPNYFFLSNGDGMSLLKDIDLVIEVFRLVQTSDDDSFGW